MKTIKKTLLLCSILLMSCFAFAGCGKKELNLNDYITVEYGGYNGYGKAQVHFDKAAFEEDCAKIKIKNERIKVWYDTAADYYHDNCISYSLSVPPNLKNGDAVILTWNCDSNLASENTSGSFVYEDMRFVVKGLGNAPKIDFFKFITIEYEGISPLAEAVLTNSNNRVNFTVEGRNTNIDSNVSTRYMVASGDVLKVNLKLPYDNVEKLVEEFGGIPTTMTKEYVVPKLDKYPSKVSEIPEEALEQMEVRAREFVGEKQEYLYGQSDYCEVKLVETAVACPINSSYIGGVQFVYELTYPGANSFTYYTYVQFVQAMIDVNGNFTYNTEKIYYPSVSGTFGTMVAGDGFIADKKLHLGYRTLEELKEDVEVKEVTWDYKKE